MFDLPIRILLIVALVTWSPAWCCCTMWTASGGDGAAVACQSRWGGMPRAERDQPLAAVAPSAIPPSNLPPCCAARATAASDMEMDQRADASGECCDDGSPCRCNDRPDELTRLDTAAKITVLQLERIALHVISVNTASADVPIAAIGGISVRCLAHPPPRSLFDQHCLLLT